ncbi:hypothetical protein ACIQVK_09670 [Streptomyces sp. NPDC090493]|uniref:hypothetical protein n=1 Tax=Streptomyces sp. NPDC090493 TaxID=3365964 RepID=UPI00380DAA26
MKGVGPVHEVSVVGPEGGEVIDLGPARSRILEGVGDVVHEAPRRPLDEWKLS